MRRPNINTRSVIVAISLWLIVSVALAGSTATYQLTQWALGPSPQTGTSSDYALAEVLGQTAVGQAASASYGACYGYRCGSLVIPPAILPGLQRVFLPAIVRNEPSPRDGFEPDDVYSEAQTIPADGSVQTRNFYPVGDVDWVRLSIEPGTYTFATSVHNNLSPDTVLALYAANGLTQLAFNDDCTGFTRASCLTYTSSVSATLYLKLWPYDLNSIGPDSWYGLSVVKQ